MPVTVTELACAQAFADVLRLNDVKILLDESPHGLHL
jgi:hypothetical protein